MVRKSKVILLWVCALLVSCTGRPSHEKFPGGQGRTTDVMQAATQKAVLGGFDPNNNPLVGRPMDDGKSGSGPTISGKIILDGKVSTAGKILFIFARSAFGGPPLAVKRIENPTFPLDFSLSGADKMAQHTVFEGDVSLNARLDSDGNAMTTEATDYLAEQATKVGRSGIVLNLKLNQ